MTFKSKSKASPQTTEASKFSRADITSIWEALSIADWLRLPQSASFAFTKYKGDTIRGLCPHPDHSDTNPSFYIRPKQFHGYCFGCGYRTIDPIELISYITGMTYPQAIVYVANTYSGAAHLKDNNLIAKSQIIHMTQLAKKIFYDICHDQLIEAAVAYAEELKIKNNPRNSVGLEDEDTSDCNYAKLGEEPDYPAEDYEDEFTPNPNVETDVPDNVISITSKTTEFDYAVKTVHWLVDTRKVPLHLLEKLPIGILPPLNAIPNLAHKKIKEDKAYADYNAIELIQFLRNLLSSENNNSATTAGVSSVVFPLCTTENHIAAFRIRLPNALGDSKRLGLIQDSLDVSSGFFGMNFAPYVAFQKEYSESKPKSYIVVEGEFDALQPMIRALQGGKVEQAVVSAGGTSSLAAFDSIIKTNDIQQLFLMGDAPTKGGKNTSENVLIQWINQISAPDCSLSVFTDTAWSNLPLADDLDQAYTASGIPANVIDAALYDKQNYIQAWRWIVNIVTPILQGFDDDAVSSLLANAAQYGKNLHRKSDIETYAQRIHELYPIVRIKPLINEILSNDGDIAGFINRIARTLLDIYSTVSITEGAFKEKYLQLFHREDRRFASIKIDSSQSIAQEIAIIAGGIHDFVDNEVGATAFLNAPDLARKVRDNTIRDCLRDAVNKISMGVKHAANLTKIRNGYHYLTNKELIVHGIDTYVLNRQDSQLTITKTTEPRIDDVIIDIYTDDTEHKVAWYNAEPLTEKLILESQNYDMRKTYEDLCRLFNAGYRFEHQRSTCKFLAALILTFPIMSCLDRKVLIHFTGETSSGKTKLMSVFSPVATDPSKSYNIQILFASRYFVKITPPAFSRTATGASVLHCIDELEFDNSRNIQTNGQIMESLRGMQSGGGGKRTISSMNTTGTTTFEYDVPVIFASITGTDRPQDMNRILQVKMKKEIGRVDPNTVIRDMFSAEDILHLRRATNFGLYSRIPAIRETYSNYQGKFMELKKRFSFEVEQRFISSLYPLLAVLETIGIDPLDFLDDYVSANAEHIVRDSGVSDADTLLNKIFQYNVIRLSDYKDTSMCYTLARVLANRIQRFELNDSGVGVFYDEKDNLLLFNLEQVIAHLIPPQARSQFSISALQLRTTFERHPAALNIDQTIKTGVLNRAKVHLGVGLQLRGVVVFRASYWLNENIEESTVIADVTPPTDLETKDQPDADSKIEDVWY